MYYVIGANGNQYGPVDEATIRSWIADGRVAASTLSFAVGESQWTPVSNRPEFREALGTPSQAFAAVPPPPPPPGTPPLAVSPQMPREWIVALLLSIFLGMFGVDRFYTGHIAFGLIKLFTGGGCGVWWIIDVILYATGAVKDAWGRPLVKTI